MLGLCNMTEPFVVLPLAAFCCIAEGMTFTAQAWGTVRGEVEVLTLGGDWEAMMGGALPGSQGSFSSPSRTAWPGLRAVGEDVKVSKTWPTPAFPGSVKIV